MISSYETDHIKYLLSELKIEGDENRAILLRVKIKLLDPKYNLGDATP
jgi:hypothetical protein